jgi:hypothetical protein
MNTRKFLGEGGVKRSPSVRLTTSPQYVSRFTPCYMEALLFFANSDNILREVRVCCFQVSGDQDFSWQLGRLLRLHRPWFYFAFHIYCKFLSHNTSTTMSTEWTIFNRGNPVFQGNGPTNDRQCGLVVRVLGYRSVGPGSIPDTTRKKSDGSGTGSTQPREYNWGATW